MVATSGRLTKPLSRKPIHLKRKTLIWEDLYSCYLATTSMKSCGGLLRMQDYINTKLKWCVFRINNQLANITNDYLKSWPWLKYDWLHRYIYNTHTHTHTHTHAHTHTHTHTHTHMVRIIGTLGKYDQKGCENKCIVNPFDLLFLKNHKNRSFHWRIRI